MSPGDWPLPCTIALDRQEQPDRALTADSGVRSALSWLPDDHRFSISTLGRDTSAFYRTDVVDVVTGRSRKMPLPPSIATIADAAFVR